MPAHCYRLIPAIAPVAQARRTGPILLSGRGQGGGLGTSFLVDPARNLAVIVLTQRMFETAQAPAVHTDLQAAVLAVAG